MEKGHVWTVQQSKNKGTARTTIAVTVVHDTKRRCPPALGSHLVFPGLYAGVALHGCGKERGALCELGDSSPVTSEFASAVPALGHVVNA